MNVIFLDFDGVLHGIHDYKVNKKQLIYKRILLLSEIVKKYNCKIVISSSYKDNIDENTLETETDWIKEYLNIFKELDIEVIGRTPTCPKTVNEHTTIPIWKEDEIILYLINHPEIEHFCVLDDDDLTAIHQKSDLDKIRDYLVSPLYYSNNKNPYEEGLLPKHKEEIGLILKKDNIFRKE